MKNSLGITGEGSNAGLLLARKDRRALLEHRHHAFEFRLFVHRIDQAHALRARGPGSAISLLNSRDLPTCYLAGVAETQL